MLRSRANEIPDLVRQLGSRSRVRANSARTRLCIIGPHAVDGLIDGLEGNDNRIRARVMPLLALIQDSRAKDPLIAMLLDRNARLRRIAANCLGRFPSTEATIALERLLERDRREDVQVAAVHALLENYSGGQEAAIRRLLDLTVDPERSAALRLAALPLLPMLRPAQRRSILDRLGKDPVKELREGALRYRSDSDPGRPPGPKAIRGLLENLAAEDYAEWNDAVVGLSRCGSAIVEPIVAEMQQRANHPEYCARAGIALKALGRRRARTICAALEHVSEPVPLRVIIEVIGALGEKSSIYRLEELIARLRRIRASAATNGFDSLEPVRARAHFELARVGSRLAIEDLRGALADPDHRLELEIVSAVEMIGKREEIAPLLAAHAREGATTRSGIAAAVRAIMRRERIRRNDRRLQQLPAGQRRLLQSILPRPRSRNGIRGSRPLASPA